MGCEAVIPGGVGGTTSYVINATANLSWSGGRLESAMSFGTSIVIGIAASIKVAVTGTFIKDNNRATCFQFKGNDATLSVSGCSFENPNDIAKAVGGVSGCTIRWGEGNDTDGLQLLVTTLDAAGVTTLGPEQRFYSAPELTIASGAITKTGAHHTVDTESDAAADDLDTINGGTTIGEVMVLRAANTARAVRMRSGQGNIYTREHVVWKSTGFQSPTGAGGTSYANGFYEAPVADANLLQGSTTVNMGTANIAHAAHAFLVAAAAGATDTGTVSIVVSGTSITDPGVRTAADSETIVADITTMSTNAYYETVKKWIGTITYTLTPAGGAATYNADFNYGFAKYEDFGNQQFNITDFECVGRAGASDSSFNIILFHHSATGWTYHASAFVPGATQLANMNTDHNTEIDLNSGDPFAYKRDNLNTDVEGDVLEGIVVKVITGAAKSVEMMDIHIGVHTRAKYAYLPDTESLWKLMFDGTSWLQL